MSPPTDAELVAAHLAGDRAALAAIYDRYADSLHDTAAAMLRSRHDAADVTQDVFVIAAERLGQLRDATRLKPWLFAVLRNEVYRRTGKKRRTVATDFSEPLAEMTLPTDDHDPASGVEHDELAALVRGAAAGLDERDQLILELHVRQGLEGDDLADALGVSPQQCYSMLHRMRQRTERSLAAYCVARQGRKDCPDLADILRGWDGEFTVLIRKRVARHVDGCETCQTKRRVLAPLALFGAAPVFAAPAGLRDRVLAAAQAAHPVANPNGRGGSGDGGAPGGTAPYGFGAPGGFPSVIKYAHKVALWMVATAAALLMVAGTTVYVLAEDGSGADAPSTLGATGSVSDGGAAGSGTTSTTDAAPSTTSAALPPTGSTSTTTAPVTTSTASSTSTASTTTSTTTSASTSATTTVPLGTTTTAKPTAPTTSTVPPAPGALGLSAGTIDFGTTVNQARVRLSNPGGQAVTWSSSGGPATFAGVASPFSYTPTSGSLLPGASVEVVFTFDRTWAVEGARSQRITFSSGASVVGLDLVGTIARPPQITVRSAPPLTACWLDAGVVAGITAQVVDESEPTTGVFTLVAPNSGTSASTATAVKGQTHAASLDLSDELGVWTWTLTATDALGNSASAAGTMTVRGC